MKRLGLLACLALIGAADAPPSPVVIPVTVASGLGDHLSGRLIVFAQKEEPGAKPAAEVDFSPFGPTGASMAARDVTDFGPGTVAQIDGETDAFPAPLSSLPRGTYRVQAVLDRNHDYNYAGRGEGDLVSKVVEVTLPGKIPAIALDSVIPASDPNAMLGRLPANDRPKVEAALAQLKPVDFQSTALTAFRGTPTFIRGWVALPPGYDGKTRFPTVYSDSGFGGTLASERMQAARTLAMMTDGQLPPMIWVFLDHSGATGTNEFADSANNGPWGKALTEELIPSLERQYAMDARPRGRFLTGHSSGGWSTLWLQVRYPKIFGGSWPTSPDPSDFHNFTNIDLYAPDANFYRDAKGQPIPLVRDHGKVIATMEQFARAEAVLGSYGGQIASFEWVFSPRGANGQPVPVFDRATGKVDPKVAAYWHDNYDVANIVVRDAAALKPDLDGKIHLTVGTADTFYLDGAAHLLEAAMARAGIKASFTYLPDKTHFDLYERGGDKMALMKDNVWAMYAVARPGSKRPAS
jgi:S-formylglutathione hydrolase FrmB